MRLATPETGGAISSLSVARRPTGIVAPAWRRSVPAAVACADLMGAVAAVLVALWLRFGPDLPVLHLGDSTVGYVPAMLVVALAWPGVLASLGAYRTTVLGTGSDEMGRVVEAGFILFAALAASHLMLETSLSGRLVGIAVALLVLATLAVRTMTGSVVRRAHRRNQWRHRVVVYGSDVESAALVRHFAERPQLGVDVVGACITDLPDSAPVGGADGSAGTMTSSRAGAGECADVLASSNGTVRGVGPTAGTVGDAALEVVAAAGADLLAVAGGTASADVRALAWSLEGTGVDLAIAPAVPDLAQQRVVVESIGGLALLRVEECRQRWGRLLVKRLVDRAGAAVLLVALSPVFAAVAVAIKRSSAGPVFYRQPRIGQYGVVFDLLKFRTMVTDADRQLDALLAQNEADGRLFKLQDDPRVTPVGRVLRRFSLDELPQIWNVLRGDMSLVGPRPLILQSDAYVGDERRRLRVKPGMTGLYQISGRRDLAWAETVALDMHYVDHWSLTLDLAILARTPMAVLRGRGAY